MAVSCDTAIALRRMDEIERLLTGRAMPMQIIAQEISVHPRMVSAYVASMRARRRLHIEKWEPADNGSNLLPIPYYQAGEGNDAPRPPAKQTRPRQGKRRQEEIEWLAAGMAEIVPRPDIAAAWMLNPVGALPWRQMSLFQEES